MGVIDLNHRMDEVEKAAADGIELANGAQRTADQAVGKAYTSVDGDWSDLNALLGPGIYSRLTGVANVSNRPSGMGSPFVVQCIHMGSGMQYCIQLLTDCPNNEWYARTFRLSTSAWTEWKKLSS